MMKPSLPDFARCAGVMLLMSESGSARRGRGSGRLIAGGLCALRDLRQALVDVLLARTFGGRVDMHQRRRRHRKLLLRDAVTHGDADAPGQFGGIAPSRLPGVVGTRI